MALFHIHLAEIDEKKLRFLIDAKVSEARDIEYKRDLYGNADADHAEWLADVSSFANTNGGDLIIGMDAIKGVPSRIAPLTTVMDDEILRLNNIALSGLQPRIAGLQFHPIPVSGGHALLVRVPRSYNPPHRIVRNGKWQQRFWARSSGGKYEPNVDELRAMFTLAPQLTERIRDFRFDRVAKIAADDAPVRLSDATCVVMHIVPFSAFDPGALVSLADLHKRPYAFAPIGSQSPPNWQVNFDGILLPSNADFSAPEHRAYTQVYRSGIVEAVASIGFGRGVEGMKLRLKSIDIEGNVLISLVKYLKGLQPLGVEPPLAVMISLIGVKGAQINVGIRAQWHDDDDVAVLTRDQYHFGEVIFDYIPQSIQEAALTLSPFIEQLANTAGKASSSSFGPNGQYIHMFQ